MLQTKQASKEVLALNLSQSMQEEQSKKEINGQPNGSNPAMNLFMMIDG